MSTDIGFDAATPSLPAGGGAVGGLGETFTPDLSTGGGQFTVRFDLPNGPNDIGPRLALHYDVGAGNGPFGVGFALPLPRLLRSTALRYPHYDDSDPLVLEGAGELVRTGPASYRPQVDGGVWRAESAPEGDGQGFRLLDREGNAYLLGSTPAARLSDPADPSRIYAWHLERIDDPLGNTVTVRWTRDGGQLYLAGLSYGPYDVVLDYEPRPDVVRSGRAGFLVTTARRATQVRLELRDDLQPRIREWTLAYLPDTEQNGLSLLHSVTLTGVAADGSTLSAPPLTLGYTTTGAPTLTRFATADGGASPGPLGSSGAGAAGTGSRTELVDWNGDGLPDLLEILPTGRARVWPNLGGTRWGRPRPAGDLPTLAGSPLGGGTPAGLSFGSGLAGTPTPAAVAFADLDGDGAADLVRADAPLDGYLPRDPDGLGFGRPIFFRSAPSFLPSSPNVRFTDLDGDGVLDLLASGSAGLSLYYRRPDGYADRPQLVPRGGTPVADLDDPRVYLADMTGDGSDDLVRVDGAGVTYWPYLGDGRWAEPVVMAHPPALGFDADPTRILLSDVDGDGCADLVQLTGDRVRVWFNRCGTAFSAPRDVRAVPTQRIASVRVADMAGTGTPGLLWSTPGIAVGDTAYLYLDLVGGRKPHLLDSVDNGVGSRTRIDYSTSAAEASRDAAAGDPWPTRLPMVLPVVARLQTTDATTGTTTTTVLRYSDGRYDGALREFAGYARVEEETVGDEVVPTLRTRRRFATGLDPASGAEPSTAAERARFRAIRGRLLLEERSAPATGVSDGGPPEFVFDRLEQRWRVDVDGPSFLPRLVVTVRSILEGAETPAAVLTTTNTAWDDAGNVLDSVQTSERPGTADQTLTLRTRTRFATDPAGRFVAKPWRVTQTDGDGTVLADAITSYDGQPEGTAGSLGLVTARSALVFTDAMVEEIYGSPLPDLSALGYHRRTDEAGWWIPQGQWERSDDGAGLTGRATGPLGGTTTFAFDDSRSLPVSVSDPFGNTATVQHDLRSNRVTSLTDASGATFGVGYDALSRLVASIEPGDTEALPTVRYGYETAALPVTTGTQRRAVSGTEPTVDSRERWDGAGRLLERRVSDESGEIIAEANVYASRGLLARVHLPVRAAGDDYTAPSADSPHTAYRYDALGRVVRQSNPDGTIRTAGFGPLVVEERDEEDNRVGGEHADTPTVRRFDPTGRLASVEQRLGDRTLVSTYSYDVKGELVRHVDAAGHEVRMWHDLLGRTVRVDRPEGSTRSVFDAAGNAVEARSAAGLLATRTFDAGNRPLTVHAGDLTTTPVARFTYHDAGAPAPPDAGNHTVGGRCVRIDDEGGTTLLDYDARGRLAHKRSLPAGGAGDPYDLDYTYRADGQIDTITYPGTGPGNGSRLVLNYRYDARGLVQSVPGVAPQIEHDLAGRRTRARYDNGTEQTFSHDTVTGRLDGLRLTGPAGEVRSQTLRRDLVGNVIGLDSPTPGLATDYQFDDLYRLVHATTGAGEAWAYRYDDAGALTFNSDLGDYRYGESGAPATCLTSAGSETFTWTALGEMASAPFGTLTFDPLGRLAALTGADGACQYAYDYAGMRVRSTTPDGERLTPDALFAIEDGTLVLHLFDGEGVAARRIGTTGATFFLHPNHLGGLAVVTDGTGAVLDTLRYTPFGAMLERTGTGPEPPFGFIGGQTDASGLLYLSARWYSPHLGIFTSADAVVQDAGNPITWAAYPYCGGNPVTFTDQTGRGFWGIFLAALAIVALVVVTVLAVALDVISFGTLSAPLAIGIIALGMVVGGVIGGLAAAQKGGNTEDIITGIFVGAAVGGWASFFTVVGGGAGAGVAGGLHMSGFWGAVVAGAVNGAITGAAMGFAAGFAGGKGTLDEIFTKMWQGALVGFVTGAIAGGLLYAFKPPTTSLRDDLANAYRPQQPPAGGPAGAPPGPSAPAPPSPPVNSELTAVERTVAGLAGKGAGAAAPHLLGAAVNAGLTPLLHATVVDVAVGSWDLGYVPTLLEKIGVVRFGGKF